MFLGASWEPSTKGIKKGIKKGQPLHIISRIKVELS